MRKLDQTEVIERFTKTHGDRFDYSKVKYERMSKNVIITCREHGDFLQNPQAHMKGLIGCLKCNGQAPLTAKNIIERSKAKHGDNKFDYSKVTLNKGGIHQKITLICITHNIEFNIEAWSHIDRGQNGCYKCNRYAPITKEKLLSKAKEIYPTKQYDYSQINYSLGVKQKNIIGCPIKDHGFFQQSIDGHLSGQEGCPKCHFSNITISNNEFIARSKELFGEERYTYENTNLTKGIKNQTVTITCPKHGDFQYSAYSHLLGLEGCEPCRLRGISKAEREIREYIQSLGLTVISNDRKVLGGKEIDILIPEKNIAIEYNGLYYHSALFQKRYSHYEKWKQLNDLDIQLFQIWEDDWKNKKELIQKHIRHILNLSTEPRIMARKTKVIEISKTDAMNFFNINHIQGYVPSSIYLGLEYKNQIVAAMSFIKQKNNTYTLTRYATNSIVVGGHSKLLHYFETNYPYKTIITFADLTFSNGNLYKKTGWTEDKLLAPDYSYIRGLKRIHKFNFRKERFKNLSGFHYEEGMTESELAEANSLIKIWDAGKIRFIRENQNN